MSNIHQINQKSTEQKSAELTEELRLNEASDWIAKLDRNLTDVEKKQLSTWLSIDTLNVEVLFEVAQMWDKMDDLGRLSELFPQTDVKQHKTRLTVTSLAASFIVALAFILYQSGSNYLPFDQSTSSIIAMQASYQTNVGESNTINLPDNTKIVLNTNSFVQVKYTQNSRIIELQRGEIHIKVAHDTSRPLSVIAGGKIIQAVGTAFNVEVRSDLVELIVTDGKVLVAQKDNKASDEIEQMAKRLPQNSMAISKGEKVDLDTSGKIQEKITKVGPLEIAASLSWRQGNLIFRGESLAQAMAEISRYTDIKFELADDESLQKIQVAGLFKTGDVTGLLDVLSRNFNISYQKVAPNKIILKYAG
ncbi:MULTISPECIES: FecR family protein [unclassified Colwellia]|uniref:FecR family protein n=1 Tax=unclassified Colwellia TaxID=196834 RepID=UPI0015F3A55F|nr:MULTISPECIES: FecR domain-containing protein [unclassified Colwellia]MBA6234055.1 FecR domain-containing protein [Colwellia sp. MB02u-7]MBA6238023.1 FecR domain-containing protein [Colwellia sp. MB02u-11]MBA6300729.1 FecR domain-containing protein [Colwellia sp. MB3u-22]MBA6311372.1 FecR domain-containing protein [Colwellia sp. MB3u-64]